MSVPLPPPPHTPSAEEWQAVTKGAFVNVGGGLALIAVKSLGIVLRKVFGGVAFGLFTIAYKLIEQITYLLLGGFVDSIVLYAARYLPRDGAPPDGLTDAEREARLYRALATCIGVPVAIALSVALALQALAPWLHARVWSQHPRELVDLVQRMSWVLPLLVLMHLPAEAIKAHLRWGWPVTIVQVLFPTISLVGAIVAKVVFDRGIMGLVDGVLVAFAVCVPLSLLAFARSFRLGKLLAALVRFRLDRDVLAFALPQGLNMALNQGLVNVDQIVLSGFVSANTVGVYTIVSDLTQTIRVGKMSISGVFSPLAARLHAAGQAPALQNALHRMGTLTAFLSLPLLLVVLTVYPVAALNADERWEWGGLFPWLLAVGPMMSCFFGLAGNTLLMVGRSKLLLMNSVVAGTLNVVLCLVLVPPLGVVGAALATAVSNATISLLQLVELARLERLTFHSKMFVRTVLAGIVPVLAVAVLAHPQASPLPALVGIADGIPLRIGLAVAAVGAFVGLYALLPGPSFLAVWRGTRTLVTPLPASHD